MFRLNYINREAFKPITSSILHKTKLNLFGNKALGRVSCLNLTVTRSVATANPQFAIHRKLPEISDNRLKYGSIIVGGVVFWLTALSLAFNYHKQHTSIVKATYFAVKYNPKAVSQLGEDIDYSSSWPWISGDINHMKGRIDVSYAVKGSKDKGMVHFKSIRRDGKWEPYTFDLKVRDETVSLLDDESALATLLELDTDPLNKQH